MLLEIEKQQITSQQISTTTDSHYNSLNKIEKYTLPTLTEQNIQIMFTAQRDSFFLLIFI